MLHEILDEHEEMNERLTQSKNWLTKLFRRETTDKLLIGLALIFFVCVCLYIIKVRLRLSFGWLFKR
jgi:hypothetical protein